MLYPPRVWETDGALDVSDPAKLWVADLRGLHLQTAATLLDCSSQTPRVAMLNLGKREEGVKLAPSALNTDELHSRTEGRGLLPVSSPHG